MGYAVQSLHTEAMPPVFISTGSPREKEYAWMSLMENGKKAALNYYLKKYNYPFALNSQ
jgi:hypothetical protein